jgi:NAD(P)-dependent dehydrogenase (short-subunit alcohol dehydrogenase family)
MTSTWLITGATSGFGRLVADRALAAGDRVIAVGRRADRLAELAATAPRGQITTLALDVAAPDAEQTLSAAVREAGGLDVLINNAGHGLFGAVEDIGAASAREVFDVNVLANLAVLRAALPALRASRGRVVQMSSFVGQFAFASSGLYAGSKAAVELISEALAQEVAPAGVRVTVVQPGEFATEFGTSLRTAAPGAAYEQTVGRFFEGYAQRAPESFGDPEQVADAIMAVVALDEPPLRLAVGADAVQGIRASLQRRLEELERWESFPSRPLVAER